MKINNIVQIIVVLLFISIQLYSQNQSPIVTNVTFTQRSDASMNVNINYDVNDVDGDLMTITMQVSNDNGVTWDFTCDSISGDVGSNIPSGTNKHIIWDFKTEHPETFGDQFRIKIIANDGGVVMGVPCPGIPTVTYEGKTYNTVQIGEQCWMKENLDVGTRIDGVQNATDNGVIEKYCYDDNLTNCETYGSLYQWNEAMQYTPNEGAQGICPVGWHIPTLAEYQTLATTVNNDGTKLLAVGQGSGTNASGFSALLAGLRVVTGFGGIGSGKYLWTSNSIDLLNIYYFNMDGSGDINYFDAPSEDGFSVRCIKDETPIVQSCPEIPTVTYEGKTYNTVLIGGQCWLKENLDVGIRIDGIQNATDNGILEKYCYDNNAANCETYGGLYQWDEAMQYVTNEGAQGICPDGWHIPRLDEFQMLATTVCNDGNTLKAIGQGSGAGVGNNISGFSSFLAGDRDYYGDFYYLGINSMYWCSRQYDPNTSNFIYLNDIDPGIYMDFDHKIKGFNIRCLQDSNPTSQTCPGIPTVTYEGKTYNTVQIGDQCWLKENLDVGVMIDSTQNQTNNSILEKYCYNDNPSNCATYGGLYQWNEAMQYVTNEGAKGICPDGWHLPTIDEFQMLATTVNNDANALKVIGQGPGTNTSGFSALFGGCLLPNSLTAGGVYFTLGINTYYWGSTETFNNPIIFAKVLDMHINLDLIAIDDSDKKFGFSIRCIKD